MPEEESGIDELMRLSRKFTKQKEDHEKQERQREEQGKKVRGVLQGLQALNLSMAITQLKTVAKPDVIEKVNALKTRPGTEDLRKLITSMVDGLDKQLGATSLTKSEITSASNSVKTLSILLDLYFSLSG
jgi:predicted component of type VI protein secretion system